MVGVTLIRKNRKIKISCISRRSKLHARKGIGSDAHSREKHQPKIHKNLMLESVRKAAVKNSVFVLYPMVKAQISEVIRPSQNEL